MIPNRSYRYANRAGAKAWQYFLAYGLTSDVLNGLVKGKVQDQERAVDILIQQCRYAEADRLLRQMIEKEKPPERWTIELHRAGMLRELGDDSAAAGPQQILDVCRKGEGVVADGQVLTAVLQAMYEAGFHSELGKALPELVVCMPADKQSGFVGLVRAVVPKHFSGVVGFWWGILGEADPSQPLEERMARLGAFLRGEMTADEADAVLRLALDPNKEGRARTNCLSNVAHTCALMQRDKDAESAYRLAVRFADEGKEANAGWSERISLANFLASRMRWSEAAEVSGELWTRYGRPSHLVEQAIALRFAGQEEAAKAALDAALPLCTINDMAWLLLRLDEVDWIEPATRVMPLAVWQSSSPPETALASARRQGDGRLERRLAQRLWFAKLCSPNSTEPAQFLQMNATLAAAECRGLVADGNVEQALADAKRTRDAFPFDVDGVADTVLAMEQAGHRQAADALAAYALGREKEFLDKLPNAVQHLNGYAWLCARTGRELAKGEECIRRALERAPDRDAYLDTLAVLLYRQGRFDEAVAAVKRCMQIDPYDTHHRYQLARWLTEKRENQ